MTTITLQLEPNTVEKLQEKARLRGQTLEAYLQQLAQEKAYATSLSEAESSELWSSAWRTWAASHAALPLVAEDSRESIYAGRDE